MFCSSRIKLNSFLNILVTRIINYVNNLVIPAITDIDRY